MSVPISTRSNSWRKVRLTDVAELNPRRFSDSITDDTLVSFVPMKAVEEESGQLDPTATKPWSAVKKGYTPFQDGDVIFAKITPCMENGKFAIARGLHGGKAAGSTEFHVFRPSSVLDPHFLLYFLFGPDVRRAARLNMRGAAGQLRVPPLFFEELEFPLPPIDVQRQIVAEIEKQFTRLEAGVAGLRRVQTNLKRYRAAVLKAACEGKLVPTEAELARQRAEERLKKVAAASRRWSSGQEQRRDASATLSVSGENAGDGENQSRDGSATLEELYETGEQLLERILIERLEKWTGKGKYKEPEKLDIAGFPQLPDGWVWSTLGQVFGVYVGATPSRRRSDYWNGKIPWVSSGEISFCRIRQTRERITELGLANSSTEIHPPGTVLIGMIGEGRTRGQVAILDIAACNNQNSAAIRVSEARLPPEYTYYFLMSQYEQNRKLGSGNNQPALNKVRVRNIPIPLPPLAEQHRIVAEVERRLSVVEELEAVVNANLQRATRLRQSILQRAFEGKLVQTDSSKVAAASRR